MQFLVFDFAVYMSDDVLSEPSASADAYTAKSYTRNRSFSTIVPEIWFLVFDFAVYAASLRQPGIFLLQVCKHSHNLNSDPAAATLVLGNTGS
eukprot:3526026-Rhodomonas_salina.1